MLSALYPPGALDPGFSIDHNIAGGVTQSYFYLFPDTVVGREITQVFPRSLVINLVEATGLAVDMLIRYGRADGQTGVPNFGNSLDIVDTVINAKQSLFAQVATADNYSSTQVMLRNEIQSGAEPRTFVLDGYKYRWQDFSGGEFPVMEVLLDATGGSITRAFVTLKFDEIVT